jgi:hypothetical protein
MCERSHSNDNGIGKVSMDVQSQIFGGMTRGRGKEDLKRKQGNKKVAHKIQLKRQKIQANIRWYQ